jgi:hypothetical protein
LRHFQKGFSEQLNRADRYLTRLHYAYEGIQAHSATFSIDQPKDDCISFFMHCYHIKDWLIECHWDKTQIEAFINASEALRVCADVCNGAKHCRINGKLRSGAHQRIDRATLASSIWTTGTGGVEVHKCTFSIVSASSSRDALELAIECMSLWKSYVDTELSKKNEISENLHVV